MIRTSIAFAAFTGALAAECSRRDWIQMLSIIEANVELDDPNSDFLSESNPADAVQTITDAYIAEYTDDPTAGGAAAWDCYPCLQAKYAALYTAWKSGGDCEDDPDSEDCHNAIDLLDYEEDYCLRKTVEKKCTFAQNQIIQDNIDSIAEPLYAEELSTFAFMTKLETDLDKVLDGASDLSCFACYDAYYSSVNSVDGNTPTTAMTTDWESCIEEYVLPEPDKCELANIAVLTATRDIVAAAMEARDLVDSMTPMLLAANKAFDVADARNLACFGCQEDYFVTIFAADGTTAACDDDCQSMAKDDYDSCMLASVKEEEETTTDSTATEETTTASGVVSAGLTAAAVLTVTMSVL